MRSRPLALILSLVPGWGHIYWGREVLGMAIFTAFAVAAFALLNLFLVSLGPWKSAFVSLAACLAFLAFIGAVVDLWFRTYPKRVQAEAELRGRRLREGMLAYLGGDLEKASHCFRSCLKSDPHDVEASFRLGIIYCRGGDTRQGAHWLRRAGKLDVDGKWHWELARELERLKTKSQAAGGWSQAAKS